jgi:hypothetical protein
VFAALQLTLDTIVLTAANPYAGVRFENYIALKDVTGRFARVTSAQIKFHVSLYPLRRKSVAIESRPC